MTSELITQAIELEITLNTLYINTPCGTARKLRMKYIAEQANLRVMRREQALRFTDTNPRMTLFHS